MSYSSVIRDCIYDMVTNYNSEISKRYDIPVDELMNIFFTNDIDKVTDKGDEKVVDESDDKRKELSKKSKKELQEMCKNIEINEKGSKKN